jgi:hypothetical protein
MKFYGVNTKLLVDGALQINGTGTAPVTLRSNKDSSGWSAWKGIEITGNATGVSIDNAVVKDAWRGIYFHNTVNLNYTVTGDITNSRFENNFTGIYISPYASPIITNSNVISQNGYGVQVKGAYSSTSDPKPVITHNSIYDNSYYDFWTYYFYNASNVTLDATYNWWGTTDTSLIEDHIYDNTDYRYTSPVVNYVPYLDGENGNPVGLP